jgi:hypothetical protein
LVVIAPGLPVNDAAPPDQDTPELARVPVCCAPEASAAMVPLVSLSFHHPAGGVAVLLSTDWEVIRPIGS